MSKRSLMNDHTATALGWTHTLSAKGLLRLVLLAFALAVFLGPFITTLVGSFDAGVTARSISLWPTDPTLTNYVDAADYGIYRYLSRSLIIAGGGLLAQSATSVMVAYSVAMLRMPGRRVVMALMLITIMIPEELIAVPLGLVLRDVPFFGVNLLGSVWAVILPVAVWGFSVMLMAEFMSEIPRELIEAAHLDGVGAIRMLTQIVLPLSKASLGVITIFGFNMIWDQYLLPLIAAQSPADYTLTVALRGLQGQGHASIGVVLAGSFLALLPSLIVYIFLQRSMISGITAGAVK